MQFLELVFLYGLHQIEYRRMDSLGHQQYVKKLIPRFAHILYNVSK